MVRSARVDPFRLEVLKHALSAVAEEMGATLGRSASSVNIKERRDYSCAVFDGAGRMLAQAAHIPVHLGSMPLSVLAAIRHHRFRPGETVILNDPFQGGTHLPDVTMVRAVFLGRRLSFFTACRAHFADIGGMSPGSMPLSRDLFQEGLVIPPVKLDGTVRRLILSNVRTPREVEGDLLSQEAACAAGERRLRELAARYGASEVLRYGCALQEYARRLVERAVAEIPRGRFRAEDFLDDDGCGGGPVRLRAEVFRKGRGVVVDFAGSSPQVVGNVNTVHAVTLSAVLYCFRCLVRDEVSINAGFASAIRVITPEGTVVNARPPAAVAAGNVETSQRIVDVVFAALARALPGRIPAASAGTMSNLSFGGEGYAYYETIAGGMGARPWAEGESAVQTHMTNTRNTPVEAMEHSMPVRVRRYRIRRGSGGEGRWRGGDGLVREIEFRKEAEVSVLCDRHRFRPPGAAGGGAARSGRVSIAGRSRPGKCVARVKPGDRVRIETPGGGGYGQRGDRL